MNIEESRELMGRVAQLQLEKATLEEKVYLLLNLVECCKEILRPFTRGCTCVYNPEPHPFTRSVTWRTQAQPWLKM